MVQYGYRDTTEVLPVLSDQIRPKATITSWDEGCLDATPVSVSTPMYYSGVILPKPDLSHASTIRRGFQKRVVNPLPIELSDSELDKFGQFVSLWLEENVTPLEADTDISVSHWLEEANYPAWRKLELSELDPEEVAKPLDNRECKSFIKDEWYPEFKHCRTINPRNDYFKVFSGPIFHAIEKKIFARPEFIKKIPIHERASYIMDHVYAEGASYICTDYTSFESSFTAGAMRACEMRLYEHCSKSLPNGKAWYEAIEQVLTGRQVLVSKKVRVTTEAGRCSGDMCTSLGNGFTNLMLMLYASQELDLGSLHGVFEGDDGLCRFSSGRHPDSEFFLKLGFTVKMEVVDNISEAGFCGMRFGPISRQQIGDPFATLATLGWTNRRYRGSKSSKTLALLRSKALSSAFQWVGCPIISTIAHRIIYLTRSIDARWVRDSRNTSWWDRQRLCYVMSNPVPNQEPTMETRLLFERTYGISVDTQLRVEGDIQHLELGPFTLDLPMPELYKEVWNRYVVVDDLKEPFAWHLAIQGEKKTDCPIRLSSGGGR